MKASMVLYLNIGIVMTQNLFFSEYIEGSSYNKGLEIFNPVNNELELTGYQLWKVTNSDGNWTDENGGVIGLYEKYKDNGFRELVQQSTVKTEKSGCGSGCSKDLLDW